MSSEQQFRGAYGCVIERPVDWGEMDAYQHVNNAVYFSYFESARMAHFEQLGATAAIDETGQGPIVASTRARFRVALEYPDQILIGSRIIEPGEDRFLMEYGVFSRSKDCLVTEGDALVVWFDYRAGGKCALPEELRKRVETKSGS